MKRLREVIFVYDEPGKDIFCFGDDSEKANNIIREHAIKKLNGAKVA